MKRINLLFPALLLLAAACKHKPQQPAGDVQPAQDSLNSGTYLPITDLIKNDIVKVDTYAGGILKKNNTAGRKDSAYIQPAEFLKLAGQFLLPELDSASFHDHFTEHSLMDETTEMLNFIYTAKDPGSSLKNVMVYLQPSLANDQVKRIYMERSFNSGDTTIEQKLTWKMMEYFYVVTIRQPKNGPAVISMEKVIWDPQNFAD
jgi:hypothetical protein